MFGLLKQSVYRIINLYWYKIYQNLYRQKKTWSIFSLGREDIPGLENQTAKTVLFSGQDLFMGCPHGLGQLLDLTKIFCHLSITIPIGIVRVDMKEALIGPHTMFHVHLQEYLINIG